MSESSPVLGAGVSVFAFDVGGTTIKATLVDEHGVLLDVTRLPTPPMDERTAQSVVDEVVRCARELTARHPLSAPKAVGLVVPGDVDERTGTGVHSENLGWRDFPFRDTVSVALDLPVALGHDVRSAGMAEFRHGAAAAYRNVVVVVIGTGIAAAVFIDGRPYVGSGMAGELGHTRVADAPSCVCGGTGCLEAIASASAILRIYNALPVERPAASAKEVIERASHGDPFAVLTWNDALDALALALATVSITLDPEAIVLGGGIAESGAALFFPLRDRMSELVTLKSPPPLIAAHLGENAGLVGAAMKARDLVTETVAPS